MKVLLAPSNIANQAGLQARALRARGHDAEFWQFGEPAFGYDSDRRVDWPKTASDALELLSQVAAANYDVIHFHFARSLIDSKNTLGELWDLALWRRLNVRLVMSFHGTDMRDAEKERQLDPWSYYHFGAPHNQPDLLAKQLGLIRESVDAMTVSAGSNFAHVPDSNYLPLAVDTDAIQPSELAPREIPVIAHAPSRRSTKGTDFVLAALDALRDEGVRFEVDIIEGVENSEAVSRLANADIVIEKVLGDGYGVTAIEALAAARVVVTRVTDRGLAPARDFPGVPADPDTLGATLRELIASPQMRAEIGVKSREFAVRHHGLDAVGEALERLYTGIDVIPPATRVHPETEVLSEEVARVRAEYQALQREKSAAQAEAAREKHARLKAQRTFGYRVQRKVMRLFGRKLG